MQIVPNGVLILDLPTKQISFANDDMLKLARIKRTEEGDEYVSLKESVMTKFFHKEVKESSGSVL